MQIMNFSKQVKNMVSFFNAPDIMNNLPDSIIITDLDYYITDVNDKARECFGIAQNVPYIRIDNYIKNGMELIASSLRNKKPVVGIGLLREKEFYIELNVKRTDKNYYISVRDVSHYISDKIFQEKAARFNQEKNAMLHKVEQEIMSPIDSISGFSKGLLDGLGGDLSEKQLKYVRIINSNINGLHDFMEKLLEFSYNESSLYESEYKQFDIVAQIKEIIAKLPVAKGKEINFEYDSIEKRTINSDLKVVQRALKNILEVSLSTVESGLVSITMTKPDEETSIANGLDEEKQYINIIIKDNGKGFEPQELKTICDPYIQLSKNRKNLLNSLKLGSASIMIKRFGGYFDIFSNVNIGSEYRIILPYEKE